MEIEAEIRAVCAANAALAEGVVWDASRTLVWFVDIKRHLLWRFDPATRASRAVTAPGQIGWALPTHEGPLLCGLQDGLYTFYVKTERFERLMAVPGEPPGNRLNDACTDPWGRVWFGSMDDAEEGRSGRFYLFDRGEVRPAGPSGISITNGPAVNRAGDRIYFTDTAGKRILVAELTAEGAGEARLFADTAVHFPDAHPDGPVVDAEDHVWSGLYLGGGLARFAPDGTLVATLACPARDITKLAFGGPDLTTCYLTTATKDLAAIDRARHPLAGSLLSFQSPIHGFAQPLARLA